MAFFNPFRPAYIEDPYASLAQLRKQEPVHRSADLNAWVVTSFELCDRVLHDDDTFSSDPTHASGEFGASVARKRSEVAMGNTPILGNSDPPDHTRLRAIVNRAFVPRAIEAMRPRIAAKVAALLDEAGDGPLEVMSALAEPLVARVVLDHIGVPDDDQALVRDWSLAIMRARAEGGAERGVATAALAAREALLAYLADYHVEGRTTVIQAAKDAVQEGEALTPEEMAMLLIHVSLAGNGPLAYALGNAALHLGQRPDELPALVAEPTRLPAAIEELFRFDSPTHIVVRFALADTKLGARTVRAGDMLYAVIGAANRDPARFPDPDTLLLSRTDNRHLSFGMGIHFCLGAPLARLELDVALRALFERYGAFRTTAVERGGTLLLRGPKSVVIERG
jgi:cytochrome P450